MIEFCDVHLKYPYDEFELLKGVDFVLPNGVGTLLCDTQSGKTSLCRLIVKDILPTSGKISVDGVLLDGIPNANLDILYLPASPAFFEGRSILYNIQFPLKVRRVAKSVRRGIAEELAERLGIKDVSRKMRTLPDQERKRVALARGLTVPRKTVLWDDFVETQTDLKRAMELFPDANHVIATSQKALAMGTAVVLDGGKTVYCGNAEGALQTVSELHWLFDSLRSE